MRLGFALFAQTLTLFVAAGNEWERGSGMEGEEGKKNGTKQKARSIYSRCKDEWFHLLFYSFRRPRSGLRSDSTALTFFLIFFFSFPASCKKMCGSRLFRSDLKRWRPWVGGSESLKNVALVWVDEDQNLLLRESQLLPLLSRLRPFSTTLALATSAFFTPATPVFQFYCSVLLLIPSSFNPRRPPLPKPLSPLPPSQFLFTRVPGASADFHIPPSWFPCPLACSTLAPPPLHHPVSLLIRLSLALVPLIPEGFVYLCWSCFYSLRLTPPIFSPVIWTAGLLCSYSTN